MHVGCLNAASRVSRQPCRCDTPCAGSPMARWLILCTLAAAQHCPGADDDALTLSTKSKEELDQLRACVLGTTAIDRSVTRILLVGTDAALTDARVVKLDASLPVKQRAQFFAAARVVVGAGAALADIVYCAPGTSVVAVGAWAHHERLARTLGLNYVSVAAGMKMGQGRNRRGQPFWRDRGPDVAALRRAVDAALGGRRLQQQNWAPIRLDDRSPCEARVHAVVVGDEDAPAAAILSYRAWQWRHAVFTTVATGISKDHFHDAVLKAEGPFASPWAAGQRTGPSSRADFFDHLVKNVVNKDGCQAGNRSRHEAHHARYLEALAAAAARNAESDWAFVVDARAHVRPKLLGKLVAAAARFGDPRTERIRVGRRHTLHPGGGHARYLLSFKRRDARVVAFQARAGLLISRAALEAIDWPKVLRAQACGELLGLPADVRLERVFGRNFGTYATAPALAAAKARSRMFMLDAAVHADAFAGQVPWGEAPATAAAWLDVPLSEPFQEGHWTQMDKLHHADDGDVGSLCAAPIPGTNTSSSGLRCEGQGICRCV